MSKEILLVVESVSNEKGVANGINHFNRFDNQNTTHRVGQKFN